MAWHAAVVQRAVAIGGGSTGWGRAFFLSGFLPAGTPAGKSFKGIGYRSFPPLLACIQATHTMDVDRTKLVRTVKRAQDHFGSMHFGQRESNPMEPEMTLSDTDKAFITQQVVETARQLVAVSNYHLDQKIQLLLEQFADVRYILLKEQAPPNSIVLQTDHPVAYQTNDHTHPRGTKNDNTRAPRFCRAVEDHFMRDIVALDVGCAGGGLVFDFLLRGHLAIGLEGSNFSQKSQRAEWRVIGPYLHTCDITKPFSLLDRTSGRRQEFDIITAWEVLEHIREDDIGQLFANITEHLTSSGLFVGSVALYDDIANGVSYHPTVKPETWWRDKFASCGLKFIENTIFDLGDFCRGSGNGPTDEDFSASPGRGFHFVAQRSS